MTIVLAPPAQTNASLLEAFAEDAALRGLTKETLRAYLSNGGILAEFLASRGKGFLDVDADLLKDVLRYVLSRKVKAKTVRAYFSALSAVCDYLQYEGLLPANPVPPFRKRYLRDYKKRRGEDDRVRRILSRVGYRSPSEDRLRRTTTTAVATMATATAAIARAQGAPPSRATVSATTVTLVVAEFPAASVARAQIVFGPARRATTPDQEVVPCARVHVEPSVLSSTRPTATSSHATPWPPSGRSST